MPVCWGNASRIVVESVLARTSKIHNGQQNSRSGLQQVQNKAFKNNKNPQISITLGIWFGSRRSVVQIHSPRPFYSFAVRRLAAFRRTMPATVILRCAGFCAHPAFRQPQRPLLPTGGRSEWTSLLSCAQQFSRGSMHRSRILPSRVRNVWRKLYRTNGRTLLRRSALLCCFFKLEPSTCPLYVGAVFFRAQTGIREHGGNCRDEHRCCRQIAGFLFDGDNALSTALSGQLFYPRCSGNCSPVLRQN
jgi:hypothetical protein